MNILFYAAHTNHISVLLDEAIELANAGHRVYFVHNCVMGTCAANPTENSIVCEICHRRMRKSLKLLPKSVITIPISRFLTDANTSYHYEYNNLNDIKSIEYKQVKVGISVVSNYITATRNINPLIDNEARNFFDNLITASCRLTDALSKAIEILHPNRICFWNSRYFDSRPALDLAVANGIEYISYERTNDTYRRNCKVRFINTTPHSVRGLYNKCNDLWNSVQLSEKEKINIGRDFFIRRRNGLAANDKVYVENQQQGLLPHDWDSSKRNFVIFNSSEDEFASIGDEYDRLALFPTQYKGIRFILESVKTCNNIHIYLRIHPNLASVTYRYHSELKELSKYYNNVTIIPAEDSVSSYALMDASEKIIVFGSTMGMEASYWGKPAILLTAARYYYSDLCYKPHSEEEFKQLLLATLPLKDNKDAVKWGFYFMYRNPNDYAQHIDIDKHWFSIGKHRWLDIHYLKLFSSSKLYAIYTKLLVRYYRHNATEISLPIDEDINAEL